MANITIKNSLPDAAMEGPSRAYMWWPSTFNGRYEISDWALDRIWKRARSLYANCAEVRLAVQTLATLVGTIMPRPQSGDEEWDREAREAFINRVQNPFLFDSKGVLTWETLQHYIERRAIIDGDVLTVLTTAKDGGGSIAVYQSPQITHDRDYRNYRTGVEMDKQGRVKSYSLWDYDKEKAVQVSAHRAILYRHNPDPSDPRGHSELIAAINTAQDVYEIIGYNKASIKFASLFGLVETQDVNVTRASMGDLQALRNPSKGAAQAANAPIPVAVGQTQAITLSPGHKLETIHDNRPSNEVREFLKMLVDSIAYSVGIDPVVLYRPEDMGSASVRFVIAKSKDIINQRLQDRIIWANKVYQYVLSCEVAAGRLRPCPTKDWAKVKWICRNTWSIDLQRDAKTAVDLINRGLMSADDYALSTSGKSTEEIFAENLHCVKHNMERATAEGIDYHAVITPAAGQQVITPSVTQDEDAD